MSLSRLYSINAYPRGFPVSTSSTTLTLFTGPHCSNSRRSLLSSTSYESLPTNNVLYGSESFAFGSSFGSHFSIASSNARAFLSSAAIRRLSFFSSFVSFFSFGAGGGSSAGSVNLSTYAATPVIGCVFFGFAGAGMYSTGGRGTNNARSDGVRPVWCAPAAPPGAARMPIIAPGGPIGRSPIPIPIPGGRIIPGGIPGGIPYPGIIPGIIPGIPGGRIPGTNAPGGGGSPGRSGAPGGPRLGGACFSISPRSPRARDQSRRGSLRGSRSRSRRAIGARKIAEKGTLTTNRPAR
mmetsp:Transcript_3841/g.13286  ORF Transcript_3841/g.13286 Transcript_3841/m.13286 type:complete len:294 (+) Transcript_3841:538-1419(+)